MRFEQPRAVAAQDLQHHPERRIECLVEVARALERAVGRVEALEEPDVPSVLTPHRRRHPSSPAPEPLGALTCRSYDLQRAARRITRALLTGDGPAPLSGLACVSDEALCRHVAKLLEPSR